MAKSNRNDKSFDCQLLACNCENTMALDAKRLGRDLGLPDTPEIYHHLCRSQLGSFEAALDKANGRKTIVTCTQEAPLFEEIASERGEHDLSFVNIRENAGWGKSGKKAAAKIAALIAESAFQATPTGLLPVISNGKCIVYGDGQQAMEVAKKLSHRLDISLVLNNADGVLIPVSTRFPVYSGKISGASGSIGKFELTVENYAAVKPSSKDTLAFHNGQARVDISCDLIFDLTGGMPLLGAAHGRDGYLHVDPQNPVAIAEAMFDIVDLVGEFEKPIFVSYDQSICAHSRSGQPGCSNCIDNCPTSAILSNGDGIVVNNEICDGCGHCSASCPTGAIAYAYPDRVDLVGRCQALLSAYLDAGGKNPVLLVHEQDHGSELISALARYGEGLAENVLPFSVHSVAHIGHDAFCAFFTSGVQNIVVLAPVKKSTEMAALEFQIELTNSFLRGMHYDKGIQVALLNEDDPDVVATMLADIQPADMPQPKTITASRNKRETVRLALSNLNAMVDGGLDVLALPANAPYGEISINAESCTLCLACIGACPVNALGDNENRPQVTFTEQACVQCGLCRVTCPENAISLTPRYNFGKSALTPVILNEDEPLECSECGKPFGSRAAVDKVIGILQGNNPMFQTSEQLAMLKMCEDCRVEAMAMTSDDPMTLGQVPRVMTAADNLDEDDEPTRH